MSYERGWDCFMPDPGEHLELRCRVCDSNMDVKRDVNGATSWVSAIAGSKKLHDSFTCPNSGLGWHKQVLALKKEAQMSVSRTISSTLLAEAELIIAEKKPTLDRYQDDKVVPR